MLKLITIHWTQVEATEGPFLVEYNGDIIFSHKYWTKSGELIFDTPGNDPLEPKDCQQIYQIIKEQ